MASRTYVILDLGTLPGGFMSVARAINSAGMVVGEADAGGGISHAFLCHFVRSGDGLVQPAMQDLGTLGGTRSFARGVDDHGHVVGYSETASGAIHAFYWPGTGPLQDIGTLGGRNSAATGIAVINQDPLVFYSGPLVTGWSETADGSTHAFLFRPDASHPADRLQDLGPLTGSTSAATSLNAYGMFAGEMQVQSGPSRAFVTSYASGQFEVYRLGTLGGEESVAVAVNAVGDVVGMADTGSATHAFFCGYGPMRDLGTLGGQNSSARAINTTGQIVGTAQTNDGGTHAFLYDGGMLDLNNVLPAGSEWELLAATGVNDAGQIAGFGVDAGQGRGFLLNPV